MQWIVKFSLATPIIQPMITATNGHADKNTVNLKETFSYTPVNSGKGSVTVAVENVYCTVEYDVYNRQAPHIFVENATVNLYVGNESKINYNSDIAMQLVMLYLKAAIQVWLLSVLKVL